MKKEFEKIYRRYYDNDTDKDGNKKPNNLLGVFEIIEIIEEDVYSSIRIGRKKNTQSLYLIKEREVCGYNGGTSYSIYPINKLCMKEKEEVEEIPVMKGTQEALDKLVI